MKENVPPQKPKGLENVSAKAIFNYKNDMSETITSQLKATAITRHLVELLTEEDINFIEGRN